MLKIDHLNHHFSKNSNILDNLSIDVSKGEIVALLGPSGCGKSTLLRLIARLLPIQSGTIDLSASDGFSFVFQDAALMPWASVAENVVLPQKIKGSISNAAIDELLIKLEIDELRDRYPTELSGGQKMRVSIARALAAKPSLLLLDEPFAALDEILRFKMNDLILELRATLGITTVFVTHSIYEATYIADRVMVMCDGKIVGQVTPDLPRNGSPENQRSSESFIDASRKVAEILAGGKL